MACFFPAFFFFLKFFFFKCFSFFQKFFFFFERLSVDFFRKVSVFFFLQRFFFFQMVHTQTKGSTGFFKKKSFLLFICLFI